MEADARRELVVVGGATASGIDAARELWQARQIVRAFALRSVRVRYRQAVLGAAWAAAQPLALLVPFVAFLRGSVREIGGVPYAASTLAALVGWQYLAAAVTAGASSLVSEAFLVRKTWFPREAPVVAAVGAALVELGIGLGLYLVAGPLLGAQLGPGLLALPLALAVLVAVALALSIPLAAVNALYRDVRHALPFVVLLWLFLSPVAYPLSRFGPGRRLLFAFANPAAGPIEGVRRCLAEGAWPDGGLLAASLLSATVIGWLGHRLFRRLAPILPDVV
jgi:ABC-type polysaccharide/polyol phosphate export permease